MNRLSVSIVSGLKAFVISGLSAVAVLLSAGVQATEWKKILLALLIAFLAGGVKGLEKAYNFQP